MMRMQENVNAGDAVLYAALIQQSLPLLIVLIEFFFAVPAAVQLASYEPYDEFAFLVHGIFTTAARYVDTVGVEEILWDEC